jgi:ubiquinone biosynthesis monooxygenase Coq7
MTRLDTTITEFDRALRTLFAKPHSVRQMPDASTDESILSDTEKKRVASLMRVNHTGEICAQALYSGQVLTSRDEKTSQALQHAALQETEHLAWCEDRIKALGGRTSLLNPLFYVGALGIGVLAGALGDKWNLGFLAETEKQVGKHLADHMVLLPEQDKKTRAIIAQMQEDEAQHQKEAEHFGAAELPTLVKWGMTKVSKIMTTLAYRL